MTIYIFILLLLFLSAFINLKNPTAEAANNNQYTKVPKREGVLFLSVSSIYLLMALKEPIKGDYSQYATNFINSSYKTIAQMAQEKGEYGFHALTKLINNLTDNPNWYFAITSAIICLSLFYFINKHGDNKKYAIYFYYTIGLFAFTLAGLRQSLAMSICLFAYQAIKDKKLIRFLIVIGIGFLFHKSAVFFLPAYAVAHIKWKKKNLFFICVVLGLFIVFFNKLYYSVAGWLNYDTYSIESTGNGGIFLLILIIISILLLIYKDKLLEKDFNNIVFINLHFVELFLWILRMFTRTAERPAFYYLYATIIILDKIFSLDLKSAEENSTKKFLILTALILFGLFFIYRTARDRNLIPYIFI